MKNDKNELKKTDASQELAKPLDTARKNIFSDIDGSYTGHPIDGGVPVQDQDDL